MDANSGKLLHNTNGSNYFIPASNVKIFTLFAAKKMLPKKAPALYYVLKNDSTYIKGTGYPTSFHPYFKDSTLFSFLNKQKNISLSIPPNQVPRFGSGWAWEDYDTYFSPENNSFPLYGNVVTVYPKNELKIYPSIFKDSFLLEEKSIRRNEFSNQFYTKQNARDTLSIPFITSLSLVQSMLEKVMGKHISLTKNFPEGDKAILPGMKTDSIAKRMMYVSDNFLAEQLLLMCSSTLSDSLSRKRVIEHLLQNELNNLKHPPRWVDGSGLSRYNLFTPESVTQVLHRMYKEIPHEELFHLFPSWNRNGTIKNWKKPEESRYIFAKSGGMGNTYNLSGYLKAKSGRMLVFSSMNNHFRVPSSQVRIEIELILKSLYERY